MKKTLLSIFVVVLFMVSPAFAVEDYFLTTNQAFIQPFGRVLPMGISIGYDFVNVPSPVSPGQQVTVDLQWAFVNPPNPTAVIYINAFGDWNPGTELARLVNGELVGGTKTVHKSFTFQAPSTPGEYRIRVVIVWAFAPVRNFYGSPPNGQYDPGVGPYTEVSFTVSDTTPPPLPTVYTGGPFEISPGGSITLSAGLRWSEDVLAFQVDHVYWYIDGVEVIDEVIDGHGVTLSYDYLTDSENGIGLSLGQHVITLEFQGGVLWIGAPGWEGFTASDSTTLTIGTTPPTNPKPNIVTIEPPPWGSVGEPLSIRVHVTDTTNYVECISLYYRINGFLSYIEKTVSPKSSDAEVEFVIPGSDVSNSGIEFYIKAFDDLGVSAEYEDWSADEPYFIPCGTVFETGFAFGRDNYQFDNEKSLIEEGLQDLVSEKITDIFSFLPLSQCNLLVSSIWGWYAGSGGYCWGMSETSAAYYKSPLLKPIIDKAIYDYTVEEAIKGIRRWQEGQITSIIYACLERGKENLNHRNDYERIINGINNDQPVVISLWRESKGAHAVVARAVVDAGAAKYVFLYNPNYSDTENEWIEFQVQGEDNQNYVMVPYEGWTRCYAYDPLISITSADIINSGITVLRNLLASQIESATHRFVLACPADALITDDMGRRIGHLDETTVVNEIPDANILSDGEIEIYEVPAGPTYSFKVFGLSDGQADIDLSILDQEEQKVRRVGFMSIPVTETSILSGSFDANNPIILFADNDGDGNSENTINPTYDELVGPNDVLEPPTNKPPIANAGPDQTVYAWIDGIAEVNLDGSGSYDEDGDELTYFWSWTIDGNDYEANGVKPTIELPVGQHFISLIVNDGTVNSEPNEVVITVVGPLEGNLNITPEVLNCRSKQPRIKAKMLLPEGITKDQIDTNELILLYPGQIEADKMRISQDKDKCKVLHTVIRASFDKDELMDAIDDNGQVELVVVGQLITGQYFFGTDEIRVICPGNWPKHRYWWNYRWNRWHQGLRNFRH